MNENDSISFAHEPYSWSIIIQRFFGARSATLRVWTRLQMQLSLDQVPTALLRGHPQHTFKLLIQQAANGI